MYLSIEAVFAIFYVILGLCALIIISIFFNQYRLKRKAKLNKIAADYLTHQFFKGNKNDRMPHVKYLINQYIELKQSLNIDENSSNQFIDYLDKKGYINKYIRQLKSPYKPIRLKSISILTHFPKKEVIDALEKAMKHEKRSIVKLFIVNALCELKRTSSIPFIIEEIYKSKPSFKRKLIALLIEFEESLENYIVEHLIQKPNNDDINILLEFSNKYPSEKLIKNIIQLSKSENNEIAEKATYVLYKNSSSLLNDRYYLDHPYTPLRKNAILALAKDPSISNLEKLLDLINLPENKDYVVTAVSKLIKNNPNAINIIEEKFKTTNDPKIKHAIGEILSNKIEYLFLKLLSNDKENTKNLIKEIISLNHINVTIGFLNRNLNLEIEDEIIQILKPIIIENIYIKRELSLYLNDRLIEKMNLDRRISPPKIKDIKVEREKIRMLILLLITLVVLFPIIFTFRRYEIIQYRTLYELIQMYIIDFNYYLIYYSILINAIYLFLLVLSIIGVRKQLRYWKLKKNSFLFKRKIMPSISIIAPAYNEEKTIVESANSLLNLKYPNYELIIINDGSRDQTLNNLLNNFELEKIDPDFVSKIETMPIRGIYKNKQIPKLTVIDKSNGGKSDALNAGLNIAHGEYFCGIDSDSLLESDALIKLASLTINYEEECIAMGGNLFPVNGCEVDKGKLEKFKLPSKTVTLFQFAEYLRAFMAGRIGWAHINSLLIISGAFGLFKKDRVIEVGGYLSSHSIYHKDTVGEDMELVVRLTRHMLDQKIPFRVLYAHNANCWTEVPETFHILKQQRDRWHRGLIDIISYHRKTIFNPKYKQMGNISFPYFFLFEVAGPLVEFEGYLLVIVAALLGLLNLKLALLLFISSILLGVFISLVSIFITERELQYFKTKELIKLTFIAIIENFGIRQLINFWRVTGYFSSMATSKAWGKMTRRGFKLKYKPDNN